MGMFEKSFKIKAIDKNDNAVSGEKFHLEGLGNKWVQSKTTNSDGRLKFKVPITQTVTGAFHPESDDYKEAKIDNLDRGGTNKVTLHKISTSDKVKDKAQQDIIKLKLFGNKFELENWHLILLMIFIIIIIYFMVVKK